LAVFASKRTELAPEIPTLRETGIPSLFDVTVDGWTGIFAPQGTPVAVVNFLNQEINKVLEDPEFKKRANGQSLDVYTPSTPAQFTDYVRSEYNRWSAVIKPLQIEVNWTRRQLTPKTLIKGNGWKSDPRCLQMGIVAWSSLA